MEAKFNLNKILNDERLRAKGIVKFILVTGFIRFALPLTVINKIGIYILTYGLTTANTGRFFSLRNISCFFLEMLVEGLIFGWIMWFLGKKGDYPKLTA
jgi:hypothetical protein